jgi:hypothetical protein
MVSTMEWASARAQWESDPTVSFAHIGKNLGVSRQAVAKRARLRTWSRRSDPKSIADRAQRAADLKFAQASSVGSAEPGSVVAEALEKGLTRTLSVTPERSTAGAALKLADEAAIDRRAEVLGTHRREWLAVRSLAYTAIKLKDMDAARHMKIVAEALKIVQDGERRAWGIDTDEKTVAVQVIVNRKAGVTIGR